MKRKTVGYRLILIINIVMIGIVIGIYLVTRNHQTVLLKSNCELPCWQGVIIGKTSKDEVVEIFNSFSSADYSIISNSPHVNYKYPQVIDYKLYSELSKKLLAYGRILFQNDLVARIDVIGNIGLNVKQAIEEFGEPEFVYTQKDISVTVFLFYPERGLVFTVYLNTQALRINERTKIKSITIFSPKDFQQLLDEDEFFIGSGPYESKIYPWNGYGEIDGKYWFPNKN